jgi:hypothetical protein
MYHLASMCAVRQVCAIGLQWQGLIRINAPCSGNIRRMMRFRIIVDFTGAP